MSFSTKDNISGLNNYENSDKTITLVLNECNVRRLDRIKYNSEDNEPRNYSTQHPIRSMSHIINLTIGMRNLLNKHYKKNP